MILWKITLRELRAHRMRTLLTAASIVVGVAAVTAVRLAVASVRESFGAMQTAVAGQAALEVTAADGGLFRQAVADELASLPGIRQTAPLLERRTVIYFDERRVTLLLWGVDPARDAFLQEYALAEGETLSREDGLLLDAAFARGLGLRVQDSVRLLTGQGRKTVTVTGLLRPRTGAAVARGGIAYLPLATVQRYFGAGDRVNRLRLTLDDRADLEGVQAEVARRLPPGLQVGRPAVQTQMAEETMRFFQNTLHMSAYFVLLAAVFIVANAFFMAVAQRRRHLAMLRAIGATQNQVRWLVLREALFLAVVATAVGVAAGWGGAVVLGQAMANFFGAVVPPPALTPSTLGLAVLFGLGVSGVGAFLPAHKAAGVSPLEGMHEVPPDEREGLPRRMVAVGGIAFPVAAALLAANLAGWLPGYDAVLGAIVLLVAAAALLAVALRPATRLVAVAFRGWARPEARLARRHLLVRQARTALTSGVLFVVSSTGVGLACTVLDNIQDIQSWYRRAMQGEFFLRVATPDLARWEFVEMPARTEGQVRAIPGVAMLYAVRFVRAEAAGQEVMIIAREYETEDTLGVEAHVIEPRLMLRKFHEGEVTIGSVLAQRAGLAAGDTLEIQSQTGPQAFRIAALENDYMAGGLTVHIERGVARRRLGVDGADVFVLRAQPGRQADVQAALERIAAEDGLLLQSYAEVTAMIDHMQSGVIAGLWAVIVLGLLVSALGVTNTLSMNVWERTREFAMLRVIAMTRGQTRRTIVAEATMLGVLGLAPGAAAGLGLAWIINRSLVQAIGHPVAFHPRPGVALAGFGVAMALVLLSAWLPARRAVNVDPVEALRYD